MLNSRAGQGRAGKVDGQIVSALDIESRNLCPVPGPIFALCS